MRAKIDLEEYRDAITAWCTEGLHHLQVAHNMKTKFGVTVSLRTIERQLKAWNIVVRTRIRPTETPKLLQQIECLFWMNLTDQEIHTIMVKDGFHIGFKSVVRLRRSIGLARRMSKEDRSKSMEALYDKIKLELDSGDIEAYGRRLLATRFRTMGCLVTEYFFIIQNIVLYITNSYTGALYMRWCVK